MNEFCSSEVDALYDCVAVCCHAGSTLREGHYTAYSLCGDEWYLFNDGYRPKAVDPAMVNSETENKNAYILFYVRR